MHRSAARDWEEPELLSDLPHNIELEQALLGILLISNASYHRVSPLVTPADFYEPLHGRLFEAIGDLVAKNSPATLLTLRPFFEGETAGRRSRSAEEKATPLLAQMACKERALRSRRPHACGDVFCTEPGRSHPRPEANRAGS